MTMKFAVSIVAGVLLSAPFGAQAQEARIELVQTGESARDDNPDCRDGGIPMTAADLLFKVGAAAVDAYVGYPVATPLLEKADRGQVDWLKVRLGLHNGKSSCAVQCVVYPGRKDAAVVTGCLSETGGDGLRCSQSTMGYDWGRIENFTFETTPGDKSTVACAMGKNWSHNRNRWFTLTASPAGSAPPTSAASPPSRPDRSEREPGGNR